jgi:acetyltransferase-like isoleucine patch superfamily enzyme
LVVGDACLFDRPSGGNALTMVGPRGELRIGVECYLNGIDVFATEPVSIGDRCIVGDCSLVTTDFHSARADRWSPDAPVQSGPIVVGDNVWLGSRTVITKGVSIGADSVVSIGSVVRADVPAGVVVTSHEQRTVKRLDSAKARPSTWPPWWRR